MPRKTELDYLEEIASKTGSATITGPVTVTNEVEIKNDSNNPLPVSDNGGSLTVDGTVDLGPNSLAALESIQVAFPSTQNVSVQNASLAVTGTFFQATQPVSATALPLPTGASSETTLSAVNTKIPSNLTVSSTRLLVDGSGVTQPVSLATAPTTPVTGTFWQATQPVSLATAPTTPVTDNGGSLTVDGSVSVSNFPATQPISGAVTANNQSLTTGSGTLPGTSPADTDIMSSIDVSGFSEIMVQFTGFPFLALARFEVSNDNSTFVPQAALPLSTTLPSPIVNLNLAGFYKLALAGARYVRLRVAGAGLSGTWVYSYTLNPRSSSNFGQLVSATALPLPTGASSELTLTGLNTKIPSNLTVSSTRLLVDGSGVTQPTRETQPTGDYVINTSSVAAFTASGSALQSASFDAGANADYVVLTLSGGGSSGAFYYDLSPNNLGWSAGNASGGFATYYDLPATSTTDAYSYKNVTATSLFGSTRTSFAGRFIIPLTQSEPGVGTITTYRYIRLNLPASNGGWRYRFASYKSVDAVTAASIPGNPSTTRVAGRVDVGYVSNLPTLTATVTQATAANLNATVVGSGSFTAAQATASNLKAQAQLLDSAGSLLTYAATGTAGTPAADVVSVQGITSGVAIAVSGPVTDTQLRASAISVSDRGSVGQATVTTFTSTSSLVLMASNSARKLLTVFNEGAGVLYLLYGAGAASITNYSVRINSGDYLEIEKYTGAVTGIFGTAGTARATEIS